MEDSDDLIDTLMDLLHHLDGLMQLKVDKVLYRVLSSQVLFGDLWDTIVLNLFIKMLP